MIGNNWDKLLEDEYKKEYFVNMIEYLKKEYKERLFILNKMKYLMLLDILHMMM